MAPTHVTETSVRSADGTTIAIERSGSGPALVLVAAAGCYRDFGSFRSLADHLAAHFTVFTYDRRGRGGSGDTLPYAIEREVEDLAAVIDHAGGSAFVYAVSSGCLLAMHAAVEGLPIEKLALFEPPLQTDDEKTGSGESDFTAELRSLVEAGRRRDAGMFFLTGIGVPAEILDSMEPVLPALDAVAPTLVYDCMISDGTSIETVAAVKPPTLVIDSGGSTDNLTGWAAEIVAALPNGSRRSLPGAWHGVPDEDLAPVLVEFFQG